MIQGNGSNVFGLFELLKTVNWRTLVVALITTFVAFLLSDVVPALEQGGGYLPYVAGLTVVVLRAIQQYLVNNTGKSI
jgi:hypothetical protein